MATTAKIKVDCPWCMDEDAVVTLDLNNLDACTCGSLRPRVQPERVLDQAAKTLARWEAVVRWIDAK